jgi:hypothetical protein
LQDASRNEPSGTTCTVDHQTESFLLGTVQQHNWHSNRTDYSRVADFFNGTETNFEWFETNHTEIQIQVCERGCAAFEGKFKLWQKCPVCMAPRIDWTREPRRTVVIEGRTNAERYVEVLTRRADRRRAAKFEYLASRIGSVAACYYRPVPEDSSSSTYTHFMD